MGGMSVGEGAVREPLLREMRTEKDCYGTEILRRGASSEYLC